MKRQLDADGYDIGDDTTGKGNRLPVVLVGVGSAIVITVSAGLVAWTLNRPPGGSEHTARAAEATVMTSLGHVVAGGQDAVRRVVPTAEAALDGSIGAPPGLASGTKDSIPPRVLESYRRAESTLATESPSCHLPAWLLAGVGKVQADHAAGGQVDASGTTTVRIVGPRLDGNVTGAEIVRDTDTGTLDGDLTFDRGVGPMLVVPQTWQRIGRDGNGDGRGDVSNSDDAALAIGTLMCSAEADLSTAEGIAAGLVKVDDTESFPRDVLPWAAHYRSVLAGDAPPTATTTSTWVAPPVSPGAPTPGTSSSSPATSTAAPSPTPTSGPGFTTQPTTAPPQTSPPNVPPRPTTPPAPRPSSTPRPPASRPPAPAPVRPTSKPTPRRTTPAPAPAPTRRPTSRPTIPAPPRPTTPDAPAPRPVTPSDPPPQVGTPARDPDGPPAPPSRPSIGDEFPDDAPSAEDDLPVVEITPTESGHRDDRRDRGPVERGRGRGRDGGRGGED